MSRLKRRWLIFKGNKRAFISACLFLCLFLLTLVAEMIANDKPIFIWADGKPYVPFVKYYPETEFGGDFETEADYKDPYVKELIEGKGWMIWPIVRYSYNSINYNTPTPAPSPPTGENWLGTDDQGRDVFARVLYGFRISVLFGLVLTVFSSIIGVLAGVIQGTLGGKTDLLFQRFMEVWGSMPQLYLIIILTSFIAPNFWWLLLVMLLFSWMSLVGVVRAEALKTRNMDYVRAACSMGLSKWQIMLKHILPNSLVAAVTFVPFILNGSVTTLTALDFLGFGLPVGSPSLGELLAQGKANLDAPWLGISGFVVIALLLSLLVFIGEGVRDAFDPRKT